GGFAGAHSADVVERLVMAPSSEDDPALAERRLQLFTDAGCARWRGGGAHTESPGSRMDSRADWLRRRWVHTGSHTTSISTRWTPGSRSKRARMSSWIMSMAGQPIAV